MSTLYGDSIFNKKFLTEEVEKDEEEKSLEEMTIFMEGGNIDSWKEYRNARKQFKVASRAAKKCIKAGDSAGAKAAIKDGKKAINNFEKCLKNIDADNYSSTIFGLFASTLLDMSYFLFPFIGGIIGGGLKTSGMEMTKRGVNDFIKNWDMKTLDTAFDGASMFDAGSTILSTSQVMAIAYSIIIIIKNLYLVVDAYTNRADESNASKLNLFRNKMFSYLKEMQDILNKIESCIK